MDVFPEDLVLEGAGCVQNPTDGQVYLASLAITLHKKADSYPPPVFPSFQTNPWLEIDFISS